MNGFNLDQSDEKSSKLHAITQSHSFDFIGVQEVNLHLKIMHSDGNWSERNKGFQGFTHCSTNIHCNSTSRRLFGGTACYLTKDTAHQAISHGKDPSDLGRWTWSLLRGRNGITTRIISGYRPVRSYNDEALTVYSQHELYFRQSNAWRDPRQAFFEDLDLAMTQWLLAGEQIILGMDLNEDTRSPNISFWRDKWTMIEPLAQLFGTPNIATCRSNLTQTPIDTVWTTAALVTDSGGMTGFGSLDLGTADHRLLWIDLNKESMFGYHPSPPQRRPTDSLPLHDPRTIRKYNNYLRRERIRLGVPQQMLDIEKNALRGQFTINDAENYERLLNLDLNIRKRAKLRCRQFYTGQVLYSETIGNNRKSIHLWNMVISHRGQGKRTDTRAIRRLMTTTKEPMALRISLREAEQEKEKSIKEYRKNKKQQGALRDAFELQICERRAKRFGTSVETQEKIVRNNRKQSNAFKKISRILGTKSHNSLAAVEYSDPTTAGTPIIAQSKLEIERVCAEEGRRRFTQSASTPSQQGQLFQDLGYRATQATVDLILTGDYQCEDENLDEYTRELLTHLSMPPSIALSEPITGLVSTANHISGWKKMRSTIASSPFGPLFSDYIAGCEDIHVADIDAAMAAIPVLTGYCPRAWRKAIDVMIPKKQASTHVTKLRIIVLFHAMFNMINKTIGRIALQTAEAHNLIPAEAYGSRPGRRANICALNKVLTYDVLRQRRLPAALCSNDAVSCYDRIVHNIASICLQRLGVTSQACHMMFGTLQELEHYISTAYGISDQHYGGIEIPLQGIGQGNGAGPAIWLIITIPLINMLRARGYGFRSTTAITGESYRFVCYTFVDDTDTIHSTMDPAVDHHQIIQEMQQAIDTWEGGLRATGGALSRKKSYWYLLSMKWNHTRQRWDYQTMANTPGQLAILGNSTTNIRSALTRHETSHAEETLGLWIAPDGNQQAQMLSLHNKIALWSDKIRTKHLTQSLAWLSITSGISMSLKYPLTATNLSKKDCSRIMKPFLDVALPALGLPRNMPHAVIFAPKEYLGYGLFDLWLHQAVDQIQACLDYGHRVGNDITGHLLRDITETLRLELGLPDSPLSYDFKKFSACTTTTKLHVIWEFCSTQGFILRDGLPSTECLRENDEFLMKIFSDTGYSSKELSILNLCRQTLQIEVTSDIATGDGRYLQPGALERRTPYHHRSGRLWPRCGTPSAHGWRMWRDAIIKCLLPAQSTQQLTLARPLGRWTGTPLGWKWFYSPHRNTIYRQNTAGDFSRYTQHQAGHATRRPTFRQTNNTSDTLPADALPTTILGSRAVIRHTGTVPTLPRGDSLEQMWYGSVIQPPSDLSLIIDGIRSGTCVAVTDGSFKEQLGTSGFTILPDISSHDDEAFVLTNHTPGAPEDIDAYRAELGGLYGIIRTTLDLCTAFQITEGALTVGCDCVSALHNITSEYEPSPNRPHHDLLSAIRQLLHNSPVKMAFRHVKGHQDDNNSYRTLDRWSQLNVDMDGLAKSYWQILNQHRPEPFYLQPAAGQWSIWYGSQRLPFWTLAQAQRFYYLPPVKQFWNKRLHSADAIAAFDWRSSALALRRLPTPQRLWIPKWLCSTLPIGRNLSRWGMPELLPCPRCGADETHKYHVLSCPHVEAAAIRQQHLDSFAVFLDTSSTEPDLKRGLKALLAAAITNSTWTPPPEASPLARLTFQSQHHLGHAHVLEGFLSPLWASAQQAHFERMGRRTTGTQWVSQVIRKIWQIAWDLWLHRRKIKNTVDDRILPALHLAVDSAINDAYVSYHNTPTPLDPTLSRWFSRQPQALHAESLDWKERWLEMVNTATQPD